MYRNIYQLELKDQTRKALTQVFIISSPSIKLLLMEVKGNKWSISPAKTWKSKISNARYLSISQPRAHLCEILCIINFFFSHIWIWL